MSSEIESTGNSIYRKTLKQCETPEQRAMVNATLEIVREYLANMLEMRQQKKTKIDSNRLA